MKGALLFLAALSLALPALAGEPIGIVVNINTNSFHLINPANFALSSSQLKGYLGSYWGGLCDVVFSKDGHRAYISNFGDSKIMVIDVSGGFQAEPTKVGEILIPHFPEDMEVTPDGRYLLAAGAAFSNRVAVVDLERNNVNDVNLRSRHANSVTVHPSGKYVYVSDYFSGMIHVYGFADGNLTYLQSVGVLPFQPVNAAVSPDGKTLIAVTTGYSRTCAFEINALGYLVNMTTVPMDSKSGQSCVFSPDGAKAYYLSNALFEPTMIQVFDVTGPGQVSFDSSITLSIPRGPGAFYGVDALAIDPSGRYLFVSNPTSQEGVVEVTVINLATQTEAAQLHCNGIPTGIAFTTIE